MDFNAVPRITTNTSGFRIKPKSAAPINPDVIKEQGNKIISDLTSEFSARNIHLEQDGFTPITLKPQNKNFVPLTNEAMSEQVNGILTRIQDKTGIKMPEVDLKTTSSKQLLKKLGIAGIVIACLIAGGIAIKHFVDNKKAQQENA